MNNLVIDGRVVGLLEQLRDRLSGGPSARSEDLPKYLHDGTQVKTLSQVQAITGMSTFASAVKVMESQDVPRELREAALEALKDVYGGQAAQNVSQGVGTRVERLRVVDRAEDIAKQRRRRKKKRRQMRAIREGKALHGQPESDFNGIAIMLGIDNPMSAERIAIPGGLKPDQLHVTIAYYGDIENAKDIPNEQGMIRACNIIANNFEPFSALLNGITRFTADPKDPIVVNVDSPVIEKIRRGVVETIGNPKSEHGFTPHMTLGYVDTNDPHPIRRYPERAVRFDHLIVAWGKSHTNIPLGSRDKKD